MTKRNEKPEIVRRLVIFSDICSSTAIVEDLKASDNLASWRNLLITMKGNLIEWGGRIGLEMYKFVGDGWILLGPHNIDRNDLFDFLDSFFRFLDMVLDGENINDLLARRPKQMGLTFGIDSGDLIKLEMNGQIEYVGRALNVAAGCKGLPSNSAKTMGPAA